MSAYVPIALRRRIRHHFDASCAYCQSAESLTAAIFEIEHIRPRSMGGETIFPNLCLACPTCNRYKADRIAATKIDSDDEITLFHPHDHEWSEHFRWSDDSIDVIPRTDIGDVTIALLRMNRDQMRRVRRMWVAMRQHPPS